MEERRPRLSRRRNRPPLHGVAHPLYFKAFGEYKNPLYIYMLAGVFKVVAPSNLAARRLSAVLGLAAVLVLAWLAWTISRSVFVAVVTMLTAAATPNLFEISRLAFEVAAYPLALACFLGGLERDVFQVTWDPASAPPGAVVVGDEQPCSGCDVIRAEGRFTAWRVR